jgi:hypothetical protein
VLRDIVLVKKHHKAKYVHVREGRGTTAVLVLVAIIDVVACRRAVLRPVQRQPGVSKQQAIKKLHAITRTRGEEITMLVRKTSHATRSNNIVNQQPPLSPPTTPQNNRYQPWTMNTSTKPCCQKILASGDT